jgi:NitT/TauT family transport system substrate-binding protein
VRRMVRAIHRGFRDTVADTAGAIATMKGVEPLLNAEVEKRRLDYTLRNVMVTDWTRANGFGGVDAAKLANGIQAVAEGYGLTRRPDAAEIFDPNFLPPASERGITIAG